MRAFRTIAAVVAWAGLALQYALMVQSQPLDEALRRTGNFVSYFTILSNILAALALTAPLVAPQGALRRFFERPSVRTAVTLYTTVTAATYIAVLQRLWNPQGAQWAADTTLHYAMPALMLIDWLIFTQRGALGWRSVIPWLAFPLGFGVYTMIRGPLTGFYPYPFLDVVSLGFGAVLVNMAAMSAVFIALGLIFVLIDRQLARRSQAR